MREKQRAKSSEREKHRERNKERKTQREKQRERETGRERKRKNREREKKQQGEKTGRKNREKNREKTGRKTGRKNKGKKLELDLRVLLVLPSVEARLKFQKRPLPTSFVPFLLSSNQNVLQSSPCLLRFLLRVGDSVFCLVTRESHECCVHLLQHTPGSELLVPHSSQPARIPDRWLSVYFPYLFRGPLQHHLRLLDHTSKESPPLFQRIPPCLSHERDSKCLSELELWQDCDFNVKTSYCNCVTTCSIIVLMSNHSISANSWVSCGTSDKCSCVSPHPDTAIRQTNTFQLHGPTTASSAAHKASCSPQQQETSNDHETLHSRTPCYQASNVNQRHATMMIKNDCLLSYAVGHFLTPFMRSARQCLMIKRHYT